MIITLRVTIVVIVTKAAKAEMQPHVVPFIINITIIIE